MVVVEDDRASQAALAEGLRLAQSLCAEVLLFHVLPTWMPATVSVDGPPSLSFGWTAHASYVATRAQNLVGRAKEHALEAGIKPAVVIYDGGDFARGVARTASENACDLIVLGSQCGVGMHWMPLGSAIERLLAKVPVPLLVCRPLAA